MYNETKQFVFLGIYSGEPTFKSKLAEMMGIPVLSDSSFGLGNVWYSSLVPDIIKKGIPLGSVEFN
jgi:hypothetical protein